MTNILVIESSIFPAEMSASRKMISILLEALQKQDANATVTRRDLAAESMQHATFDMFGGLMTDSVSRSPAQAAAVARSETLVDELLAADVIVIGAPMYNFGIPSTLKAWIDHVTIAGKTFRYSAEGRPEGIVTGKRVIVVASRGGVYVEGPMMAFNFQDTYLRAVLGFLGMTDVQVIDVERTRLRPEQKEKGLNDAIAKMNIVLSEMAVSA